MANTYTSLHYHLVFSTKNRIEWIRPEIENRVWSYIGGIARKHKMTALQVGGVDDHIHALVMSPPTLSPSQMAQYLKGESSKWIHETFPELRDFGWQEGYGAFSVSKSNLEAVVPIGRGFHAVALQAVNDLPKLKCHDVAKYFVAKYIRPLVLGIPHERSRNQSRTY